MKQKTVKTLAFFLIAMLLFSLLSCAPVKPADPTASPTEASGETEPTKETETEPAPVERTGDIVILYTSDVHCGIDQGFGYAGLQAVREALEAQGNAVLLVDDGDSIQGEPIGTTTKGEAIIDLMNLVGYDVVTPGNHEFDYGMEQFMALVERANFPYISCNFRHLGERVFDAYKVFEVAGKKVAFVGISTPETLTSSSPKNFMDENGNTIYDFMAGNHAQDMFDAVQAAVDDARKEGAEFVIALAHLGNKSEGEPWTYADLIANTTGIDVLLDGHSHDTDQVKMRNKNGETVIRSACGTKFECIGWCKITKDGDISAGLYNWKNEVSAPVLFGLDNKLAKAVKDATAALNEKLGEVVGKAPVELTINDPVEKDSNGRPIRMIRRAETNLGDFCADAYRAETGADIAFVNGGGIRVSIKAGDITLHDIISVHPFGNELCMVEVSGQTILDALEWACRSVPDEGGGFQQVSGIRFEVHVNIDSPCVSDENGYCVSINGPRRVQNVFVGDEPLDPNRTYTLASHNYLLKEQGGGFSMLAGAPLLLDCVKLDNQVLIDYIQTMPDGVISDEYADPYGQGRIVIVE